jgi:capsular polysaccharide biosynthesis protein
MGWDQYLGILRRRWKTLAVLVALDLVISGALFLRSVRHLGYQACTTVYVADVGAPGLISAPETALQQEGALLAGETAANFFGDDVVDVAGSQHVARFVSRLLAGRNLPNTAQGDINGAVGGSRRDRTVSLCATNPNEQSALAIAGGVGLAMTRYRSLFFGSQMAKRVYTAVVSDPSASKASARHELTVFAEQFILGLLVAGGLVLLWDALDPRVRDRRDLAAGAGVPVIEAPA